MMCFLSVSSPGNEKAISGQDEADGICRYDKMLQKYYKKQYRQKNEENERKY